MVTNPLLKVALITVSRCFRHRILVTTECALVIIVLILLGTLVNLVQDTIVSLYLLFPLFPIDFVDLVFRAFKLFLELDSFSFPFQVSLLHLSESLLLVIVEDAHISRVLDQGFVKI